jgi:hypothetical protein
MRTKLFLAAAAGVLVALAAGEAVAAGATRAQGIRYTFVGHVLSAPNAASSSTALSISVEGGSHAALVKMLGAPVNQTFAVGSATEFLKWSDGVPHVVGRGDLAVGDVVSVNVRAAARASLAQIEATAASLVGDRGANPQPPDKPLFLFRGTLNSAGSSTVSVHVRGGNRHALRLLFGQSADQTFAVDGNTVFLLWQGKVPTVVSPGQLKPGDRIAVRVRAAKGSSLGQVASTPAAKVAEHEPTATR